MSDDKKKPWEQTFPHWLLGGPRRKLLFGWMVLGAVLHAIGSIAELRQKISPDVQAFFQVRLAVIPALLHVITVGLLIVVFLPEHMRIDAKNRDARIDRGLVATKLIFDYWSALWVTWFVFYAFLTWRFWHWPSSSPPTGDEAMWISIGQNLCNNVQTAILFALYWELTESTLVADGQGGYRRAEKALWPSLVTLIIGLAIAELGAWGHVWKPLFSTVAGLAAGVAIALFVGRLDSKRIAPPRYAIGALYLYACIQSLFGFLDSPEELGLSMFSIALLLKLVMFLVVYWTFASGRLLYYSVRITELMEDGGKDFEAFASLHFDGKPAAVEPPPGAPADDAIVKVFVAAPMSSVDPDALATVRSGVLELIRTLAERGLEVYCAVADEPPWEPADRALEVAESALRESDAVVLVYPAALPTSALVEIGMALALAKPCVVFVRNGTELPYLLQELSRRDRCRTERFRDYRELRDKVAAHWDDYVS